MGLFDKIRDGISRSRRSSGTARGGSGAERDPSWRALAEEIGRYGAKGDPELIGPLQHRYAAAVARVPEDARMALLLEIIPLVEGRSFGVQAFFPFLFAEDSIPIISTAALHAAGTWTSDPDADPLTGVRALMGHARGNIRVGDETCAVGIFTGLLCLGDRRVVDEVGPCWRELSPEGRADLARVRASPTYAPIVEWLMDWMEDCEGDEFGSVAGAMARSGMAACEEGVVDVDRALPVWSSEPDDVVRIARRWTAGDFIVRLRPRLLQIAADETAPRIMFQVLRAWGIDHTRRLEAGVTMNPVRTGPARRLLPLLPPHAREGTTLFDLVPMEDTDFLSRAGRILLSWAIFNPHGPTWSSLGVMPTDDPEIDILFYRMLNPFSQASGSVGVIRGEERRSDAVHLEWMGSLFEQNVIGRDGGDPVLLLQSPPTLVLPNLDARDRDAAASRLLLRSPALEADALALSMRLIRENLGRPWDRATAELRLAIGGRAPESTAAPASAAGGEAWLRLVESAQHCAAELVQLPSAWHGSIDQVGVPLGCHAYTFWQLDDFLFRYGQPVFRAVADALGRQGRG
jgi:hypothetical protein